MSSTYNSKYLLANVATRLLQRLSQISPAKLSSNVVKTSYVSWVLQISLKLGILQQRTYQANITVVSECLHEWEHAHFCPESCDLKNMCYIIITLLPLKP